MSSQFRLEDFDVTENPITEASTTQGVATLGCQNNIETVAYVCRPDNCQAGGVCRSKRNREYTEKYDVR